MPQARILTLNEMFSKVWNPVRRKDGGARLASEDEAAWRIHLSPMVIDDEGRTLGEMPPEAVTTAHAKRVSKTLAEMAKDPALKFGEARLMGVVCKFFQDMAGSYDPNVSILEVDPFKDVRWPPKSKRKAIKQQLLPDEFLALISCPDTPLVDARSYAMALYTQARGGEVRVMMKSDADVALGLFNVLRAFDAKASKEASQAASRKAGRDVVRVVAKETKGGKSRSTEIEPNLLPLLLAMKAEPGDYFFPPPPTTRRSGTAGTRGLVIGCRRPTATPASARRFGRISGARSNGPASRSARACSTRATSPRACPSGSTIYGPRDYLAAQARRQSGRHFRAVWPRG